MNKAFERSTGDIIVYLNADDELAPNMFSTVVDFFRTTPNCQFLVGKLQIFQANGAVEVKKPHLLLSNILQPDQYLFPLNPVSYFYKRAVQTTIGPFPINNHYSMDYWFLLRVYSQYKIFFIDKILGNYYLRTDNKSANQLVVRPSLFEVRHQFLMERGKQLQQYIREMPLYQSQVLNYLSEDICRGDTKDLSPSKLLLIEKKQVIKSLEKQLTWHQQQQEKHTNIFFLFKKIINLLLTNFFQFFKYGK